jgi:hypothetical protein
VCRATGQATRITHLDQVMKMVCCKTSLKWLTHLLLPPLRTPRIGQGQCAVCHSHRIVTHTNQSALLQFLKVFSFAVLLSFSKHSYGFYDCGKLESLTLSPSSLNENTTYPVVVDSNVYTGFNGL